jgi:hypothetical protein
MRKSAHALMIESINVPAFNKCPKKRQEKMAGYAEIIKYKKFLTFSVDMNFS